MTFRDSLLALRAGELDFDEFASRHADNFEKMAGHFIVRWNPEYLTVDDLVQEGLLEAWRAVDSWDPTKTPSIVRYVEYQIGKRLRLECERVLGWPRKATEKRAGKDPIRSRSFERGEQGEETVGFQKRGRAIRCLPALSTTQTPEDAVLGTEATQTFAGLERDAVAGVVAKAPIKTIAQRIYSDPQRRREYGLSSLDETIRVVRRAIKQAPQKLRSSA